MPRHGTACVDNEVWAPTAIWLARRSTFQDRNLQRRSNVRSPDRHGGRVYHRRFVRQDQYHYYRARILLRILPQSPEREYRPGSPANQAGLRSDISYVKGIHNIKAGITYEHTFLTENDSLESWTPRSCRPWWMPTATVPGERRQSRCAVHDPSSLRFDGRRNYTFSAATPT